MTGVPAPGARPSVSVLVVGYGSPDLLRQCLTRLVEVAEEDTQIVVVDNGSDPSLRPVLETFVPRVDAFVSETNLGFGRACNLARARCTGDLLLLLNPDALLEPGAVEALVGHMLEKDARAVVTGRLQRPDGALDPYSALGRPGLWSEVCFATGLSTLAGNSNLLNPYDLPGWRRDDQRQVGVVTGCVMLVRASVWDQVGGFDPRFFMYGEDVDLSLRVAELGHELSFIPMLVATHVGGGSSSSVDKTVMVLRGKATVHWRHRWVLRRVLSTVLLHAGVALRSALDRTRAPERRVWASAWRRRADWRSGWPPVEAGIDRSRELLPLRP